MLYLPPDPKPGDPIRTGTITAILKYLRQITPRQGCGHMISTASGGTNSRSAFRLPSHFRSLQGPPPAWPFKVCNTTTGSTGQVQINGGDGFVASLNGFVANVNGNPNDTLISGVYPQLAVTGNGVIYAYAVPTTPESYGAPTLASLDIYYGASVPSPDSANPFTYAAVLLATITGWVVDGSGNVSFVVNNSTNTGYAQLVACNGAAQFY